MSSGAYTPPVNIALPVIRKGARTRKTAASGAIRRTQRCASRQRTMAVPKYTARSRKTIKPGIMSDLVLTPSQAKRHAQNGAQSAGPQAVPERVGAVAQAHRRPAGGKPESHECVIDRCGRQRCTTPFRADSPTGPIRYRGGDENAFSRDRGHQEVGPCRT